MVSKILFIIILMCSVSYAEIPHVTLDDVRDHSKIVDTLNQIIDKVNSDVSNKATKVDVYKVKSDISNSNVSNNNAISSATDTANVSLKSFNNLMAILNQKGIATHTQVKPSLSVE